VWLADVEHFITMVEEWGPTFCFQSR
jgi:hypothetical protein